MSKSERSIDTTSTAFGTDTTDAPAGFTHDPADYTPTEYFLTRFSHSHGPKSATQIAPEITGDAVTRRRVGQLLGERRQALPRDRHVTDHTHLDGNGDKIETIEYDGGTIETNLTKLLGAAPSTSSNLEILERLEQWCAENELVPAWEVVCGRLEVSDR